MIRRNRGMKFLGGYYAFPGGKVDPADGEPTALARCRGVEAADATTPREGRWLPIRRVDLAAREGVVAAEELHAPVAPDHVHLERLPPSRRREIGRASCRETG